MKLNEIWGQLESDLSWRQDEIRLLSNTIQAVGRESNKERIRRAQVVMLYAHTEGFVRVAFATYVRAVNDLQLRGSEASTNILASSLADVFHAITYGDPKGKVFSRLLPDDPSLYIFCRQRDFIEEANRMLDRTINIPETAVDTESSLGSKVLRRNLYRLGFPIDRFSQYHGDLNELVNRRHVIAHGVDFTPVKKELYEKLQRSSFQFMDELILSIVDSIEGSSYLKYGGTPLEATNQPWLHFGPAY